MKRYDIINTLAQKNNAKDYLEVGISRGRNFVRVNIEDKIGVDPMPRHAMGRQNTTHVMTSDKFFEENYKKFDVIFIDGLHVNEQVYKDINNALNFLNDGGFIVCHDMNPDVEAIQLPDEAEAKRLRPRGCRRWAGDCWKAWVRIRQERDDLIMHVVDTDEGCGVISKAFPYYRGTPKLDIKEELTYKGLEANRKEWLDLITVEEFKKLYE